MQTTQSPSIIRRRFGSDVDVEILIGVSRKKLRKDRLFRRGFPYYRVGRRVLYDLDEVVSIVRSSRGGQGAAA